MKIFIESTDNKNIIKFVCEQTITDGSIELERESETNSPLIKELFSFPFIQKVYVTANFIAVQKIDRIEWEDVLDGLKTIVNKHYENGTILLREKKPEAYTLYAEITPNPAAMKFVANRLLVPDMVEVKAFEDAETVPLAKELFQLGFVKEVFISENYISVIKDDSVDWQEKTMEVRELILNYLRDGNEIVSVNYQPKPLNEGFEIKTEFSDIELKIKDILEEYIKPAVAGDGGNIDLIEFDEETKTAHMLLQGSCSGCPSSTITLKNGIQTMLTQMLPGQVHTVEAVNG